jgi:hypothetical protein
MEPTTHYDLFSIPRFYCVKITHCQYRFDGRSRLSDFCSMMPLITLEDQPRPVEGENLPVFITEVRVLTFVRRISLPSNRQPIDSRRVQPSSGGSTSSLRIQLELLVSVDHPTKKNAIDVS